ncbi:MAG: flagellar basal body-associated FliL family protein [Natronospirillum sp.]|uniref:flagellar basal body-associated FliL family protein n=1 Tax=Natronospirillum sp. TaxID=2812955 RepID=UPI0025D35699|nr:flagellar basal body-associated FliL family protein [Natronospirillum sp.]MCH8552564.1 flagellar basal body-associated FliL family protein [Natronospirillum sp.]
MITASICQTQSFFRQVQRSCRRSIPLLMVLVFIGAPAGAQDAELQEGPVDHTTEDLPLARYVDLQPEFVLNYGRDGRIRFLRMEVNLVTGGEEGASQLNYHAPALRHIVVLNVTEADRSDLNTSSGREALRRSIRSEMRAFMEHETGSPQVERVLFSNLIVQ